MAGQWRTKNGAVGIPDRPSKGEIGEAESLPTERKLLVSSQSLLVRWNFRGLDRYQKCKQFLAFQEATRFNPVRSDAGQICHVMVLSPEKQQRRAIFTPVKRFDRANDQQVIANVLNPLNRAINPCNCIVKERLA